MKNYSVTFNGRPVKISDNFIVPEEYRAKVPAKCSETNLEGTITAEFNPGPLYQHKMRTGRPRLVEVLPWQ